MSSSLRGRERFEFGRVALKRVVAVRQNTEQSVVLLGTLGVGLPSGV